MIVRLRKRLTLAAIAMGGFLLGSVMNIVQGFRRTKG